MPRQQASSFLCVLPARLDRELEPSALARKIRYLTGEKVINLADKTFRFNGWSLAVQNIPIDFADKHAQTRKVLLGLLVIVRVMLKDGTYHEDVGYGHTENCWGKGAAFAKAKKDECPLVCPCLLEIVTGLHLMPPAVHYPSTHCGGMDTIPSIDRSTHMIHSLYR
jgi:Rad52/22 family double-strand break repair protein